MKNIKFKLLGLSLFGLLFTSCLDELDTKPVTQKTLEQLLAEDPKAIEGLVSKMYGTFALSGPNGPGSSDITGPDAGETAFLRGIINLQDFTADGMKNRWGDDGLDQLTTTKGWTANNKFFRYLYDRVYYTVPQTNNIIKILNESVDVQNEVQFVSELRFLRSLAYFYLIDCFGKGALATEKDLGSVLALKQATRLELFNYVETELKDVETKISQTNTYGRANKSVVRMLLSKLYLNAQVYTGTARYNDAAIYLNKIISEGGYSLNANFVANFSSDNNTSSEIIFPLLADPLTGQGYGNTTYLINGNMNAETMNTLLYGNSGGSDAAWAGHRATKAWYSLFGNLSTSNDDRAKLFWTAGHSFEMGDYKKWSDGYPVTKFRNTNFSGTNPPLSVFSGTDFPLYRLSDVYLMYAECALRGASGASVSQALIYVNKIRERAVIKTPLNPALYLVNVAASQITASQLNLNFILDERARELNLEGHRRTDLIRFGKFSGATYLWPWKGGDVNGISISSNYNLFPIPRTALDANINLTQNSGY